jgi:hypothetical protein
VRRSTYSLPGIYAATVTFASEKNFQTQRRYSEEWCEKLIWDTEEQIVLLHKELKTYKLKRVG